MDIALNPVDQQFLRWASISTVTFFDGGDVDVAEAFLRARVSEVVVANPWLTGRLYWGARGVLRLSYEGSGASGSGASGAFAVADAPAGLDADTGCEAAGVLLEPFVACSGIACVGVQPPPPLFRVTLLRIGADRFALIVSLSHTVADGATYYALFAQLGVGGTVRALRAERLAVGAVEAAADAVMGGPGTFNEYRRWLLSPASILRAVSTLVLGERLRVLSQPVPPQWVAQQKAAAGAGVSTNDVVTSGLARLTHDDVVFMSLNLRGRAAGIDATLAGNYETSLPYTRDDAATPAAIRASLSSPSRLRRVSDAPLPTGCGSLRASICAVTNWAGFAREELRLPGGAVLRRHAPVAAHFFGPSAYIIFAPRAGEVEVLAVTRNPRVTAAALAAAFAPAPVGARA